jgi:hypothetical protein
MTRPLKFDHRGAPQIMVCGLERHVEGVRRGLGADAAAALGDILERGGIARREHQLGALPCKLKRCGAADAARRTSDHHDGIE